MWILYSCDFTISQGLLDQAGGLGLVYLELAVEVEDDVDRLITDSLRLHWGCWGWWWWICVATVVRWATGRPRELRWWWPLPPIWLSSEAPAPTTEPGPPTGWCRRWRDPPLGQPILEQPPPGCCCRYSRSQPRINIMFFVKHFLIIYLHTSVFNIDL